MRTIATFSLLLFFFAAHPALAQFTNNFLSGAELSIEISPEYPQPGEEVTAKLSDHSGNTHGSAITWQFNGETIPESTNQRQIIVVAGESGVTQTIEATLTKPSGSDLTVKNEITPIYLDIVIEPQTHVPSFYEGRSLPSIGSHINATALISDPVFNNPDLVYTWRVNQAVIEGGPIRGRNKVSFTTPMGDNMILSVQASRLDGEILSSRAVFIPSVVPEIHFYEVSTLFGINEKTIQNLPIIGNSVAVRAEPYYLDSNVYNNPDIINWSINNQNSSQSTGNPYEVTLQRTGQTGGATLEFHVRDTTQILQGAKGSTRINF